MHPGALAKPKHGAETLRGGVMGKWEIMRSSSAQLGIRDQNTRGADE